MKNTVISCLVIGLGLLFSGSVIAADEQLVVKTSAKSFSFVESKSIEVQTLLCKDAQCAPVKAAITQYINVFKVEDISVGKYRFSKKTNLRLAEAIETTVTFHAQLGDQNLQAQERISVNPVPAQVQQPKVRKYKKSGKWYKWNKKWSVKKNLRHKRYLYQRRLARSRVRQLKLKARNLPLAKVEKRDETKVAAPVILNAVPKVEKKPPVQEVVRTLPGQLQHKEAPTSSVAKTAATPKPAAGPSPASKSKSEQSSAGIVIPTDKGKDVPKVKDTDWFWLFGIPIIGLVACFTIGVGINSLIDEFIKNPLVLAGVHLVFIAVYLLTLLGCFLSSESSTDGLSRIIYAIGGLAVLLTSTSQAYKGFLGLGMIRVDEHNNECPRSHRWNEWQRNAYPNFFVWLDDLKDNPVYGYKNHPIIFVRHKLKHVCLDPLRGMKTGLVKQVTSFLSCITIILIIQIITYGQKPAIIYDAQQTAISQNGLIAIYEIKYSDKLFDAQTSFSVQKDLVRRPPGGHFYLKKQIWQLGDDAIDIANKYRVQIFTTSDHSIEVWSARNLKPSDLEGLISDTNAAVKRAFEIREIKSYRDLLKQGVAKKW